MTSTRRVQLRLRCGRYEAYICQTDEAGRETWLPMQPWSHSKEEAEEQKRIWERLGFVVSMEETRTLF